MDNQDQSKDPLFPEFIRTHPAFTFLRDQYHIPVLALVFVYMLAVRLQRYGEFVTDSGIVFSGNDAWYHYRMVKYTIANWPFTMPFDPWTGYPTGVSSGQFGTLFDQILATVALIVGLGSPGDHTVRLVMVLAPPVIGALIAIPTYALSKHLFGRPAGILSAIALGLTPGVFLSRSLVGVADHNIAEPLFMGLAALALVIALDRASDNAIVIEQLHDITDKSTFRTAFAPSILAGVAAAAYLYVWAPGVLFIGIAGIFYTLYTVSVSLADRTPEPILLVGIISNLTLAAFLIPVADTFGISTVAISTLQIGMALSVALWCGILIGLSRYLDSRDTRRTTFAALTLGGVAAGATIIAVVTPDVFTYIYGNLLRVIGFGQHASTLTIGEAQPFIRGSGFFPTVLYSYGILFFAAAFGFAALIVRIIRNVLTNDAVGGDLFLAVWAVIITLAAFTQVRFNYYLAPIVAIFAGYAVIRALSVVNVQESFPHLETYQYASIILVIAVVFVPVLALPMNSSTAVRAQQHGVGEYTAWDEPLNWMNENTPEYDSIEYYGTYERTNDFQYEDDVYGVMSWWDYGHYTTVTAERAPIANPFQQHATESAEFLLATNETEANNVMDDMGESNARYVLVDWKMVTPNSKFGAPVVWHPDLKQSQMYDSIYLQNPDGSLKYGLTTMKQRYYESLMVRLYHHHGSATTSGNVVVDYSNVSVTTQNGEKTTVKVAEPKDTSGTQPPIINQFNSSRSAAAFSQSDNSTHYGGIGLHPRERVEALEHYRLVKTSQTSALASQSYKQYLQQHARFGEVQYGDFTKNSAWVKIFERVPGATVHGSGAPANATVVAQVQMKDPTQGATFVYRNFAQTDENGEFTMILPYSTTGYDKFGTEDGYTNVSVRANSKYQFVSIQQQLTVDKNGNQTLGVNQWQTTAHISEEAVNGDADDPITVTLEPVNKTDSGVEKNQE